MKMMGWRVVDRGPLVDDMGLLLLLCLEVVEEHLALESADIAVQGDKLQLALQGLEGKVLILAPFAFAKLGMSNWGPLVFASRRSVAPQVGDERRVLLPVHVLEGEALQWRAELLRRSGCCVREALQRTLLLCRRGCCVPQALQRNVLLLGDGEAHCVRVEVEKVAFQWVEIEAVLCSDGVESFEFELRLAHGHGAKGAVGLLPSGTRSAA